MVEWFINLGTFLLAHKGDIAVWLLSGGGVAFTIGFIKVARKFLGDKFGKNKYFKAITIRSINGFLSSLVAIATFYLQWQDLGSATASVFYVPAVATAATLIYRSQKFLTHPLYTRFTELLENQRIAEEVKESEKSALLNGQSQQLAKQDELSL